MFDLYKIIFSADLSLIVMVTARIIFEPKYLIEGLQAIAIAIIGAIIISFFFGVILLTYYRKIED